ncbi:FAD-dependent oxidoreductase [Candidatus Dojkabacteria bacterium]|nr:FAD-dependent oxidoreductase [Candidatus Dojkabacteria bacterium]
MPENNTIFDCIVIGTGMAGYTASIYLSRYKVTNLIIGNVVGGQASEAHKIENYPGIRSISGFELAQKFNDHAKDLGAEIQLDTVTKVAKLDKLYEVSTASGKRFYSKTLLITTGKKRRKLGLKEEDKFMGKGLTYCTTCDGPFYKDKVVAVIGGSDAANSSSIYLSEIAQKVYQIYRGEKLRGEQAWIDQVHKAKNIEVLFNTNVIAINGRDKLESIDIDAKFNSSNNIVVDGLFIEIGAIPDPTIPKQLNIKLDDEDYIVVDQTQATSTEGIWAAGDITTASNKYAQIVTAAGEAALAARSIFEYLQKITIDK